MFKGPQRLAERPLRLVSIWFPPKKGCLLVAEKNSIRVARQPTSDQEWVPRRWVLTRFGLPARVFDRAVAEGFVRSAKFGESQQAARVFFVADVQRYMLAISAGRTPNRVAGTTR